ncbi:MerC family mercury resistance protein [Brevundimonas sp.]|uniref:MerC family mercury resistance protein n=1 Tax=Brevundimonas sp. TaxID=1871086 RepID=UPI0017B2B62A|nr:MerC family mercury resistance protein [Brevundimonas sp.]MBA4806868.1 MerC family mercury resistance protein [Brevundimonas sp.]
MPSPGSSLDRTRQADLIGAGLSVACVVHCLSSVGVLSLLPVAGLAGGEWLHWTLAAIAAVAAWVALVRPRVAAPTALRLLAGLGIAALIAGAAELPTAGSAPFATIAGGVSLVLAHLLNLARMNRARPLQPV